MVRSIGMSILGVVLLLYGMAGLGLAWYGYSTTQQVVGQVRSTAEGIKGTAQRAGTTTDASASTNGSGAAAPQTGNGSFLGSLFGDRLRSVVGSATGTATAGGGDQQGPALLRLFNQQVTGLVDQALALVDQVSATITLLTAWQAIHSVISLIMGGVLVVRAAQPARSAPVFAPQPVGGR